jgi:plastocyanin
LRLDRKGGVFMRRFLLNAVRVTMLAASVAILAIAASAAFAEGLSTVVQQGRAFRPGEITLTHGDTLTIRNRDEFIHQIYVKSDAMNFDSDEQPPGQDVLVKFPAAGTFQVRCHIHPKMSLIVHVK